MSENGARQVLLIGYRRIGCLRSFDFIENACLLAIAYQIVDRKPSESLLSSLCKGYSSSGAGVQERAASSKDSVTLYLTASTSATRAV